MLGMNRFFRQSVSDQAPLSVKTINPERLYEVVQTKPNRWVIRVSYMNHTRSVVSYYCEYSNDNWISIVSAAKVYRNLDKANRQCRILADGIL